MELRIKLKPRIIGQIRRVDVDCWLLYRKKSDILRYIERIRIEQMSAPVTIAYTLEKHRRKTAVVITKRGAKTREVTRLAHWVAHVYFIPDTLLLATGCTVVQGHRTFKLVPTGKTKI